MAFNRKTLSAFLSEIFIAALGEAPTKSPDAHKVVNNFSEWFIANRERLNKNRRAIARLWVDLGRELFPILDGKENIDLQSYIKERIIQDVPEAIHSEKLDRHVEEAIFAVTQKMFHFFEIVAQELQLDREIDAVETESEWSGNLLAEIVEPRKKEVREPLDLEGVLKEVFYRETAHYIICHLDLIKPAEVIEVVAPIKKIKDPPPIRIPPKRPRLDDIILQDPLQKSGKSEEDWSSGNVKKKKKSFRQKISLWSVVLIATCMLSLISPLSFMLGYSVWDLWKNKEAGKKKTKSMPILRSEFFPEEESARKHYSQPCELLSDNESNSDRDSFRN